MMDRLGWVIRLNSHYDARYHVVSRGLLVVCLAIAMGMAAGCGGDKDWSVQIVEDQVRYHIRLEPGPDSTNRLACYRRDSLVSSWPLPYPVYQFQPGDINGDGIVDIGVGVVKTTRRDPVVRRRLFLFQLRNGNLIPLWLGSSLSHPLLDFRIITDDDRTYVRSLELEQKKDTYLVAEYAWFSFGLSFTRYMRRDIPLKEAEQLLAE